MLAAGGFWLMLSVSEDHSLSCVLLRVTQPVVGMLTAQAACHKWSKSALYIPDPSRRRVLHAWMNELMNAWRNEWMNVGEVWASLGDWAGLDKHRHSHAEPSACSCSQAARPP
jgi:hypothetical protein